MASPSSHPDTAAPALLIGRLGLLVAVAAGGVLAADQLQLLGEHLPGCGAGSGCAAVTSGPWSRLPLIGWPLSFLGLAWFVALLVATFTPGTRALPTEPVALGAAASVALLGLMAWEGAFCVWCGTAHAGHLLFVATTWSSLGQRPPTHAIRTLFAAFAFTTAVLAGLSGWRSDQLAEEGEQRLAHSTDEIVAGTDAHAFTSRHLLGAEQAPIQIMMFADYQCPDCRIMESIAQDLVRSRTDASLSVKHYPLSTDCQPGLSVNHHPNACWAARAAEAADILGGNDAFWTMHDWIFERRGAFTDRDIETAAREAGLDPTLFLDVMQGPRTAQLVADDVTEARSLGIRSTPMIFINGVELKEYTVENALGRAVDALAQSRAAGETLEQHAPAKAREKFVADWRDQTAYDFSDVGGWGLGPDDAPVQIVVWGDTTQSQTRAFDAHLQTLMAGTSDIRYVFLEYPLESTCRKAETFAVDSCLAPATAVAAGQLGGAAAFWAAHRWLCAHEGELNGGLLTRVAGDAGLDPAALAEAIGTDAVAEAIAADVVRAQAVQLGVLPGIFVNGKWVPRWRSQHHPDIPVLQLIIDEARASP